MITPLQVLCAFLAGLMLAGAAFAQDWEYRVRAGDTLWDVSAKYLVSAEQTPRLQEYNGIEDPFNLRPGSTVRVPVDWLRVSPAPAEILELSGQVGVRISESEPDAAASIGRRLWAGSALETGPNASATVGFADGSQLLVASETRIAFDKISTYSETGMVDTRMRLLYGRVESRVRPSAGPASRFTIDTPPATSTVRGTQLRMATDQAARRTTTEVTEGAVEVQAGERHYMLHTGYGLAVDLERPPTEPAELLPAPEIGRLDEHPWRVGHPIEWPAVPGAVAYRLQLAETSDLGVVLADDLVTGTRGVLPEVAEGRYVLRLRAVDNEGIEGHDAVRPLVLHDRPEPPFVIEPGPEDRLNPGRVRFRWAASATAAGYRLQVSGNENFDDLLLDLDARDQTSIRTPRALDDGAYFWRVAGRDDTGREGPFSDPQHFEIRTGPVSPDLARQEGSQVRWRAGPPDHRYHVQVARDADFTELISEATVDEPRMALDELPRGRLYMRIREIDGDGYTGPFGPAQRIDTACWPCRIGAIALTALVIILL